MKENLILLANSLANDEDFAREFVSKKTIEEKYEFSKTKFDNYSKKEFLEFLEKLESIKEYYKKNLTPQEMENVSGGIENKGIKLAAMGLLTTYFLATNPIANGGVMAIEPQFYTSIGQGSSNKKNIFKINLIKKIKMVKDKKITERILLEKIKKWSEYKRLSDDDKQSFDSLLAELKDDESAISIDELFTEVTRAANNTDAMETIKLSWQKSFYQSIFPRIQEIINQDNIIKKLEIFPEIRKCDGSNDFEFTLSDSRIPNRNATYSLKEPTINHIFYGDYNKKWACHKSGGHTHKALEIIRSICDMKCSDSIENPMKEDYKSTILEGGDSPTELIKSFSNGVEIHRFLDSSDGSLTTKTILPKSWTIEKIVFAIKSSIREGIWCYGVKDASIAYIARVDNVNILTCVDSNTKTVITCFPLNEQEINVEDSNIYTIIDPSGSKNRNNAIPEVSDRERFAVISDSSSRDEKGSTTVKIDASRIPVVQSSIPDVTDLSLSSSSVSTPDGTVNSPVSSTISVSGGTDSQNISLRGTEDSDEENVVNESKPSVSPESDDKPTK